MPRIPRIKEVWRIIFYLRIDLSTIITPDNGANNLRKIINMNKSELIEQIAKRSGLTLVSSRNALDALLSTVSEALASGDRVQLVGFGTFKVTERKEREGRNPQTGEVINIPATKTPSFSAGAELKKSVNK